MDRAMPGLLIGGPCHAVPCRPIWPGLTHTHPTPTKPPNTLQAKYLQLTSHTLSHSLPTPSRARRSYSLSSSSSPPRAREAHIAVTMPLLLLLLMLLLPATPDATSSALLGINYGRVGNNLPPPSSALQLLATLGVGRVRLYDADPATLRAFANTGVELIVGVPDECLAAVSTPSGAASWVRSVISPALPATKIAVLTVGNEVLTGANSSSLSRSLLPAMQCIHDALAQLGLDKQVAVTTAHNLGVLATSYPPSSAYFRKDLLPILCPILDFHARTGSPFLVNAYPYFAYAEDSTGVELEYALLEPGHGGVPDPSSGLHYPNMLVAQVDAVYHAIAAANRAAARAVEVRVSETGWPSAGDANETGATPQNAARYNGNVMRLVAEGKGTPLRPSGALRVYMFALFNENMKPGPSSERNYGLFKPDGTPAYELSYRLPQDNTKPGAGGGGGGSITGAGGYSGHGDGSQDGGYYSISASAKSTVGWWTWTQATVAACVAALMMIAL